MDPWPCVKTAFSFVKVRRLYTYMTLCTSNIEPNSQESRSALLLRALDQADFNYNVDTKRLEVTGGAILASYLQILHIKCYF